MRRRTTHPPATIPGRRVLSGMLAAVLLLAAGCGDGVAGDPEAERPVRLGAPRSPGDLPARDLRRGDVERIVDQVQPSVVTVLVETDDGEGSGSGVIWSEDGLIVTNNHVVDDATEVEVALLSGERLDARVRATDPSTDLALLQVRRDDLPAATFAKRLADTGELAVAIGSPLGFQNTVTAGIVSGAHRSIPSGGRTPALVDLLQTDAAISPGNSGGALIGADGEVIGINVAYIPPEARAVSIGFAIPSPTAIDVIQELLETGKVRRGYLGVDPAPLTGRIAERFRLPVDEGAIVMSREPGGAADRAGIRPGDIIIRLDGRPVRNVEDLFATLREKDPGEKVKLTIIRDRDEREIVATLDERPGQ